MVRVSNFLPPMSYLFVVCRCREVREEVAVKKEEADVKKEEAEVKDEMEE